MVKLSPKTYLQQDFPDYLFDCHGRPAASALDSRPTSGATEDTAFRTRAGVVEDTTFRSRRKSRALVCGAKSMLVEDLKEASRQAGLLLQSVTVSQIGLVNAFKYLPVDSHGDVVALLDIGFHHSTINIVSRGDLMLTRIVNLGAERFAEAVTEVASGDIGDSSQGDGPLSENIQNKLQNLIIQLVKEVDASIGFFVSQQEVTVNQVYVSGGSARSQFIVQTLEVELGLPCEAWNPTRALLLDLPEKQKQEIGFDSAQLAVAIGAGLGSLDSDLIPLNLLAEEQEAAEARRRDPVRRGLWVAAAVILSVLLWAGALGWKLWTVNRELARREARLKGLKDEAKGTMAISGRAGELERTLAGLQKLGTNRFLWAPTLNALQFATLPDIQFHRLRIEQTVATAPASKTAAKPARPGQAAATNATPPAVEKTLLIINAKNYGDAQAIDKFIDAIAGSSFFTNVLRREQPVLLKDLQNRQVDPAEPTQSFVFFTTECVFTERTLKDD
jgi:hypothetical protein